MLSGGLDSLGALHLLLTESPRYYNIHCHHIQMVNDENRWEAEDRAVSKISAYYTMKGGRQFGLSTSRIDMPTFNSKYSWDMWHLNLVAGAICEACPSVEKVALGRTKDDDRAGYDLDYWKVVEKSRGLFDVLTACKVEKIYPVVHLTKQEIYDSLPQELRVMAWSCRRPQWRTSTPVPCGHCVACVETQALTS
jgi:7-cyano-7-deazaguanine synthase in queuosine biosynthesis